MQFELFGVKVPSRTEFDRRVEKWISGNPNWLQRLAASCAFVRYNRLPAGFRLSGLLHWVSKFGPMAAVPGLSHFVYGTITLFQAGTATAVLFVVYLVTSVFDARSATRAKAVSLASAEAWIRFGDLVNSVKSEATPLENKDISITSALGVIEAYARQVTRSLKGEVSVSLALYTGEAKDQMLIRHRNTGNERPVNRSLKKLERVLGHIACTYGPQPRVVPDLKKFGKEAYFSPTQSSCNYRSIVLIPVEAKSTRQIIGFISVDCARPHAFHGAIAEKLVVTTEPLVAHIEEQH